MHLLYDDGSSPHADRVPLAGEGEALYPTVAVPLEVDDDRAAALRSTTGHGHVCVFQNPFVAGVLGVVHDDRYTILPVQETPTARWARAQGCPKIGRAHV